MFDRVFHDRLQDQVRNHAVERHLLDVQVHVETLGKPHLLEAQVIDGERDLLNQLLNLTLANRQVLLPKLAFLAGLVLNRARGSGIYQEYRAPALAMADAERDPATDAFAVTAVAYQLFDRGDAFDARVRQLGEQGRQAVPDWLASLQ